jgi:membrane protein implicated in regulation of membrane protease activity
VTSCDDERPGSAGGPELPTYTLDMVIGVRILDLGIDIDVWPWIWLGVAVSFALVEMTFLGGTFVLLPWAGSAFVAMLLGFYDVSVEVQWTVFLVGGALLFAVTYRWVKGFIARNPLPKGVGADRLIGLTGYVTDAIRPEDSGRKGRVTIEGEVWAALGANDSPIEPGVRVRVAEVIGTRVVVTPVASDEHAAPPESSHDGPDEGPHEGSSE